MDLSRDKAGWLGQYLDNIIYQEWARTSADIERPPVQIPGKVKLGKYSPPMIYYVAGGTLYREREKYFCLSGGSTQRKDTEKEKLAVNLVEKRTRRAAKNYASKSFYEFICSVELVYLTKLNIKMIKTWADSDIMDVILGGTTKNKHLANNFCSLCGDDVGTKEQQQILKYLMERYANMHGIFCKS